EEHALEALSRFAGDTVGNHIIGSAALGLYLNELKNPRVPLQKAQLPARYAELADKATALDIPHSLVPGKFAKFTALSVVGDTCANVLVKFSGSGNSLCCVRWADLLICEHLASRILPEFPGIQAAETGILHARDRTFLESVRFDRHDRSGRSPVCSWTAINYAWYGLAGRAWTEGADRLRERGLIEPHVVEDTACIWHF